MAGARVHRKPAFFWQGVLILLPVALMVGFGMWAIRRERGAVEQAARERAQEILRELPEDFGGAVGSAIHHFVNISGAWFADQRSYVAAWPEKKERPSHLEGGAAYHASVAEWWKTGFRELQPEEVAIEEFTINPDGAFSYDDPPEPPEWLAAMSPEQWRSWRMLGQARFASPPATNLARLVEEFLNTKPPPPARACAEFIRLCAELKDTPVLDACKALVEFALKNEGALSESGLPLSNVALAEALQRAGDVGPTEQLWQELIREVEHCPSVITPRLLDEAERLVDKNAKLRQPLDALRHLWTAHQRQRALAEVVKAAAGPRGLSPTNRWTDFLGERWFCIVSPAPRTTPAIPASSAATPATNAVAWHVCAVPKAAVESSFTARLFFLVAGPASNPIAARLQRSLDMRLPVSRPTLPEYCGLSAELEGEPLTLMLFTPQSGIAEEHKKHPVLAELLGHLTAPASTGVFDPRTGRPLIDPQTGRPAKTEFDLMPGHPRFVLRIHLADRDALYAEYRQRQLIFGALIVLSGLAALVGFVASRHAFGQQLRLNEMKSNFVSSVSHELRAPVASMRLMAESLERGKVQEARKQNEYFRFMVQECRRLSALIENVLNFSRIEQGRKQYEFEPTDVLALTQTTVKLMEPNASEKGVRLALETSLAAPAHGEGGNLELNVDGKAIQQALVNLIDNAIKHSPKGETVMVGLEVRGAVCEGATEDGKSRVEPPTSRVSLWVEDHGPGIPPEEHEKIFERFYRRGSELRRETQGVGIGLSIVKHIVEAHGGRVLVQSEVGRGSRFTIELAVRNQNE